MAKAFNCEAFTHSRWDKQEGGRRQRTIFIGVSPAQEIAKYAYDTLHLKVSTARREYIAKIRRTQSSRGTYTPETRGNHFAEAWIGEVHDKLLALVPAQELTDQGGTGLVLVERQEQALIEAFVKQLTNGAGALKAKARNTAEPNIDDILAGMLAGRRVEVSQGVASAGSIAAAIASGL